MWKLIIVGLIFVFFVSAGYVLGKFDAAYKTSVQSINVEPTPTLTIEPSVAPTEIPTLIPTRIFTPTATPTLQPTVAAQPFSNPNKDSICRNQAELKRIQLEEQLFQVAYQKLPSNSDWTLVKQGIKNEAQKAYYQIYNICLTQ